MFLTVRNARLHHFLLWVSSSSNSAKREEGVQRLGVEVASRVEKLVVAQQHLQTGLRIWGRPILSDTEADEWEKKLKSLLDEVNDMVEERYGNFYPLHPSRAKHSTTSNREQARCEAT